MLIFSHANHERRAIACELCHPAARTSRSAVDLLLPGEATCRRCHAVDRAAAAVATCGKCHRDFAVGAALPRVQSQPPAIKFSHAAHTKTACRQCHPTSAGTGLPQLPGMASCLQCHREAEAPQGATARCALCHLTTPAGRIDVSLAGRIGAPPSGIIGDEVTARLRPRSDLFGDAHRPGFATDHKAAAMRSDRTCAACHDESYCSDCHAGAVRPMQFHPGDYLQVHSMEARRAASECSTCHRQQSFCVGCHERVGVTARAGGEWTSANAGGGSGAKAFHPLGWVSIDRLGTAGGTGQNLHAREARRNLTTCTSCHREDDCLPCHSADAGGLRVSPHPRSWRGSAQCRALDRGNRRMCLRCHVAAEEVGCDWSAR